MKNNNIIKLIIIITIVIISILSIYFIYPKPSYTLRWTQEYIIGHGNIKGEVDVNIFGQNPAYEIGANKNGYAVFKNPEKAFKQMKKDCQKGLKAIQKEYSLVSINNYNFKKYKTYGWQLVTADEESKQQGQFITNFLDIYENSFK